MSGDIDITQLADAMRQLEATMRGGAAGGPGNTTSSAYRMQPGPEMPFGNPLANLAYAGVSGYVANKTMGMNWPRRAPLMPGMNPFAADYAQRSTGPAIGISSEVIDTNIAAMGGRFAGNVLATAGVGRFMGYESNKAFADMIENNTRGSSAARALALFGMQTGAATAITGGDIVGASRRMYGATPLGGDGNVLELMKNGGVNYAIGSEHAKRTGALTSTLLDRMFGRDDGTMGITPNMGFTKGFDTGQIMDMHTLMSERGYRDGGVAYRDADAEARSGMIGKQLNALGALRDITGESDLGALNEIYNQFAGGEANRVDPDAMAKAFDKMGAMAAVFGKEGKAFVETALNLQQQLTANAGKLLGGSATAMLDAGGNIRGGLGSVEVATQLSKDAYALATARGDTSARAVQQAGEEQGAANAIWLGSTQGRDALAIEWLRQSKELADGDYEAWKHAINTGDKRAQERAQTAALRRSSFGSAAVARASMENPALRAEMMSQLKTSGMQDLLGMGLGVMEDELEERTRADAVNRAGKQLTALTRGVGGSEAKLKAAERARVEAMAAASGGLDAAVMKAYDSGGMSEVHQLMNGAAFDSVSGEMRTAGQVAANESMVGSLKAGGSREQATLRAGAAALPSGSVDPELRREFSNALNAGDTDKAKALYGRMRQQAGAAYNKVADRASEAAGADFDSTLDNAGAVGDGKASASSRLMTETAGGVAGLGALFRDTREGREQAKRAEKLANEMVTKGFIEESRNDADERRVTLAQRTANFIGGDGDILDLLGIRKPADLTHDQLMELSPEATAAWYEQDAAYWAALSEFGDRTAADLAAMGADKMKKVFGKYAADAGELQKKVARTGPALTKSVTLDTFLTAEELANVMQEGGGLTGKTTVGEFLDANVTGLSGDDTAIGRARKDAEERLAAAAEQAEAKNGGAPGDVTATVGGSAQLVNKDNEDMGRIVMDGMTLLFKNLMGGG